MACCPFHDDHTPSFAIYDNGFYCYGCNWKGDGVKFLMQHMGWEKRQALDFVGTPKL